MEFFETLALRHSIRAFSSRPVEEAQIQKILEAANQAPSAGNLQAYEVYVVGDSATRRALAQAAYGQEFLSSAPLVLVYCAHPARNAGRYGERGRRLYAPQDATIACTFSMLAVTALGLATVWVGAFDDDAVSRAIALPTGVKPVAMLPIGYAGEEPMPTTRRPLEDLVHRLKTGGG